MPSASDVVMLFKEFAHNLSQRFPEKASVLSAKASLDSLPNNTMVANFLAKGWYDFIAPHATAVHTKDTEKICTAFDTCPIETIKDLDLRGVMTSDDVDPETKESIWKYLHLLTVMAQDVYGAAPAPAPAPAPAARADPSQIASGFAEALPKILATINDTLKNDDGNNPLAQIFKSVVAPDQLQAGMAGNLASTMMQRDTSLMSQSQVVADAAEETGLTADEIVDRLKELDNLKRLRAKRRK